MSWTPGQQREAQSGKGNYSLVGLWLRRFGETYFGAWLMDLFQSSSQAMASAAASGPTPTTAATGGGGPLSFMGCMREASPPPYDEQQHHHHGRPAGLPTGEYNQLGHGFDSMPKEPKKRRFHPLRGLRRIFRRKSRGAADARATGPGAAGERELSNGEHMGLRDREEVTLRDPAGRPDEIRSRSASELLTDLLERDRQFARRRNVEESFANLQRGGVGQLSVSHDSVFPGEVAHTRPLSSLDMHASLERRSVKASNTDADHKDTHTAQRHRISLRVLEQIKTVIENRNQIAAATTTTTTTTTAPTEATNSLHSRFANRERSERNQKQASLEDTQAKSPKKDVPTLITTPTDEVPSSPLKEDLPDLPTGNLSHTAALHRISVRPKNRRPPRRSTSQSSSNNPNDLPRISSISENSIDTLDSLEGIPAADTSIGSSSNPAEVAPSTSSSSSPPPPPAQETKPIPILRKSSSRLSRSSDVFEELEAKLPSIRKAAASPDSLESNLDASKNSVDALDMSVEESAKPVPIPKASPRTASTGSESYDKSPRRRSSSNRLSKSPDSLESDSPGWLSKSSEGFDKLSDLEREGKPVPARRLLLLPISKSQERVYCSKSQDSFEALNSDDSMERRRSSFEMRASRVPNKLMSKSTDCFEATLVEHQQLVIKAEEKRKRASVSDINLSRSRYSKPLSKSSESFERIDNLGKNELKINWRPNRRMVHSSESSDNLDLEDNCKLENRPKAKRSTPKRLSSGSSSNFVNEQDSVPLRKPPRLQKSSESSELGSTDTLDSERRNTTKSSDSEETLDSLEKDLQEQSQAEQERKEEESTATEREKSNSEEEDTVSSFWKRRDESKDSNNLDIQLLAYTLVSRIQENGNGEHNEEQHDEERKNICQSSPVVVYPKKKQHQQQSSSDDNKTFNATVNNLLSSKTNEDLQNMLNGNISEVSTDTKSFKEKLIMFEKLGK